MGPIGHTVVSTGVGVGVWAATGSPFAVPAAAAAGVLVDADHLLDYYLWYGRNDKRRLFVLLHAWEFAVAGLALVAAFGGGPILWAAVLGYLSHVVGDHVANHPTHPLAYSLGYRIYAKFDLPRLVGEVPETFNEAVEAVPLWSAVEPTLRGLARRLKQLR